MFGCTVCAFDQSKACRAEAGSRPSNAKKSHGKSKVIASAAKNECRAITSAFVCTAPSSFWLERTGSNYGNGEEFEHIHTVQKESHRKSTR